MTSCLPRKIRRKQLQHQRNLALAKKGITLTTSTFALAGVMLPLLSPKEVAAASVEASTYGTNQEAFINMVAGYAAKCANQNDLYASVMIAQAILESGWGTSQLSSAPNYNLFGIKGSYQGQTVYMNTLEYLNGQWVTKNEPFRKYPSYYESFQDNARVLKTTSFTPGVYYYAGAFKSNTKTYQDATAYLTGRYATDPTYGSKLNNLIAQYNLARFDTPATGQTTPVAPNGNGNSNNSGNNNNTTNGTALYYTVKAGEGLWGIAQKHGTTVAQLKAWNGLTSDLIHPNQKLIVGYKTTTTPAPTPENNSSNNNSSNNSANNNTSTNTNTSHTYHVVVKGDSLWALSQRYGTSIENIKSWNNLSSNVIYVNQKLIVKKGSSTTNNNGSTNTTSKPNPAPTPTPKPTPSTGTYTVKAGDSLYRIAMNHGLTLNELIALNPSKANMIHPGDVLIIKANATNTPSTPTQKPSSNSTTTYKVQKGDTLWGISKKFGLSVAQLKSLNNLTHDTIYLNQVLKVK